MSLSKYIALCLLLMLAAFGCRPKEAVVAEEQLHAVDLSITWTDPEERSVCILKVDTDSMYLYTAAGIWNKVYYSQKLDSTDRSIIYRAVKTAGSALQDTVVPCIEPAGWHYRISNHGYVADCAPTISVHAFVDSVLIVLPLVPDFKINIATTL